MQANDALHQIEQVVREGIKAGMEGVPMVVHLLYASGRVDLIAFEQVPAESENRQKMLFEVAKDIFEHGRVSDAPDGVAILMEAWTYEANKDTLTETPGTRKEVVAIGYRGVEDNETTMRTFPIVRNEDDLIVDLGPAEPDQKTSSDNLMNAWCTGMAAGMLLFVLTNDDEDDDSPEEPGLRADLISAFRKME